jgi:alanyl-tRNA synthetase
MLSADIREGFLQFYADRGHTIIPSASLVPVADPTLLLINAGMAPLKRYFMGQEAPPAPRCANSQKCVRTIDIDQVGRSNRHLTFFEMLGKWSFGDYFKREAMEFTLDWYRSVGLDFGRIYITHHEKDDDTRRIWSEQMGWPADKLFGLGDKDNLWAAGDVGPWGYDTEYFWDFAPDGQPVDRARFIELCELGRIVEIGNDVFMEFSRDEQGNISELPMKNVDFGGGLERLCMVLQDKPTIYQTDSFDYLIRGFAEAVTDAGGAAPSDVELFELGADGFNPYWLAADHIRTTTLLLGDGVTPGNVGRNYVLRRLIRRIIAQAYRLGIRGSFIMRLADLVIGKLGGHYIELRKGRDSLIEPWISKEEEQFFKVMDTGYGKLAEKIEVCLESRSPMPGEFLFELYDTYGFPFDIARELCGEQHVDVMEDAFDRAMAEQRQRARGAAKFEGTMGEQLGAGTALFTGWVETSTEATVTGVEILDDVRKLAPLITANADAPVRGMRFTTDRTPFYSAAGGQPDDTGWLPAEGTNFHMQAAGQRGMHIVRERDGELPSLEPGSAVVLAVDVERRNSLRRPHTTNHLMLRALKEVLGTHVNQAGSQLALDEIRFDFSHFQACTPEEVRRIEDKVNRWILEDHPVTWTEMELVEAKKMGVTAVFDEKYGATVRVVSVGEGDPDDVDSWVSRELCGGTHVDHTAQAGSFAVVREESVSSGIRRIYALTGFKALAYARATRQAADALAAHYKLPLPLPTGASDLLHYMGQVQEWSGDLLGRVETAEVELRQARQAAIEARRELTLAAMLPDLEAHIAVGSDIHILVAHVDLPAREDAKYLVERFAGGRWKVNYAVFIAANINGKAALCSKVSPEAAALGVSAAQLIREAGKLVQGGGGGSDTFAEAGGRDGSAVEQAAVRARELIAEKLAG